MSTDDDAAGEDDRQFGEMESHDMDNDYEGGQWIDGEFLHAGKRQKRGQTKNQQIYGMFASDDEDEDDGGGRGGRSGGRGGGRGGRGDLSKPVKFNASRLPGDVATSAPEPEQQQQQGSGRGGLGLGATVGLGSARSDLGGGGGMGRGASMNGSMGMGTGMGMGGLGFTRGGTVTSAEMDASEPTRFTPGLGAGSGGMGMGGLGFTRPGASADGASAGLGLGAQGADEEMGGDDSDEDLLPNDFGQRILEGAAQRRKEQEEVRATLKQQEKDRVEAKDKSNATSGGGGGGGIGEAGLGFAGVRGPDVSKLGDFEKHTKGIGLKLLEKMGYKKGGGLGKDGTGMSKPMETKMRPKAMGMGYNDFKEVGQTNNKKPVTEEKKVAAGKSSAGAGGFADQIAAEERQKKTQREAGEKSMWKRRNELHRSRREYRTAEEVLAEQERADAQAAGMDGASGGAASTSAPRMTIIDMRGSQAQVVTDLSKLSDTAPDGGPGGDDDVYLPELQHNLRLVVDLAEAEIQTMDAKIRQERDTVELLSRERRRLADTAARAEDAAARVAEVLALAEKCDAVAENGGATLGDLAEMYAYIKGNYGNEYEMYGLCALATAHAHPLVARAFGRGWDPLRDPGRGVGELRAWRELLLGRGGDPGGLGMGARDGGLFGFGGGMDDDEADPMTRLLAGPVIRPLRSALTTRWNPTDPEPALRFFEAWAQVLPRATAEGLLHGVVLPRLRAAVDAWSPTADPVPIHTWLHPWLPALGAAMAPLWAPIRHKLTTALAPWHPSDASALTLLAPWRAVFGAKDWDTLLTRSILPKLQFALAELVINPANQVLDQVRWVLAWEPCVPAARMAALLEAAFFPPWLRVLHQWLSAAPPAPPPDLEEVTHWYLGWKSLFSEELLAHERVRRQLNVALDMMNQAVAGEGIQPPGASNAAAAAAGAASEVAAAAVAAATQGGGGGRSGGSEMEMSLREAVEAFAAAHDLQFLPKPGRAVEGLQVYAFGTVSVTVDSGRQVLRAQVGERWAPVGLDQLLEQHKQRLRAKSKTF